MAVMRAGSVLTEAVKGKEGGGGGPENSEFYKSVFVAHVSAVTGFIKVNTVFG